PGPGRLRSPPVPPRLSRDVEINHGMPVWLVDGVGKDCGPRLPGSGLLKALGEIVAIEDVVAQHQGAGGPGKKVLTDEKCLRQTIRRRLHCVAQINSPLMTVAEQLLVTRRIRGG